MKQSLLFDLFDKIESSQMDFSKILIFLYACATCTEFRSKYHDIYLYLQVFVGSDGLVYCGPCYQKVHHTPLKGIL